MKISDLTKDFPREEKYSLVDQIRRASRSVHRNAAKYLQRLPEEIRERVKNALGELSQQPLQGPNVKHMVGDWAGEDQCRGLLLIGDIEPFGDRLKRAS